MKKKFFNAMLLVATFAAIVSCSKNDEAMMTLSGDEQTHEFVVKDLNESTRGIDPSQVIANLAQTYGWIYDFNSGYKATPASHSSMVFYVFQSMWNSSIYLTVVINTSAQIVGFYDINFTTSKNTDAAYEFTVTDSYSTFDILFQGWIAKSVPGPMANYLAVYSTSIDIPSDYPFPFFANVTGGQFSLQSYTYVSDYPDPAHPSDPPTGGFDNALLAAVTFYANFYE